MPQYLLVSTTLAQPIERVRGGGKIPIALICRFEPEAGEQAPTFTTVGFGFANDDTPEDIMQARVEAIKDGQAQFQLLSGQEIGGAAGLTPKAKAIVSQAFRESIATPQAKENVERFRAAGNTETADKLEAAPPDHHQAKLAEMFEAIGMEPIDILGKDGGTPWTAGEVIALSIYLEGLLKKFEATDSTQRAY